MEFIAAVAGLAVALYFLVGPGLGMHALSRVRRLERRLDELRAAVDALARKLGAPQEEPPPTATVAPPPEVAPAVVAPPPALSEVPPAVVPPSPWSWPPKPLAEPQPALEERLTSSWLVWLGGLSLALGAAFLVKYSLDRGWIGPEVRVALGAALGLALIAAGETVRQRQVGPAAASLPAGTVPQALVAAGLFALFASVYSAYALYDLIAPVAAFVLLAMIAAIAVGLALLHGPFVALLGILGGYATPFLVATAAPSAWGLFPYLLALTASALGVMRWIGARWIGAQWIGARWLGWAAAAGAIAWPLLWFAGPWRAPDALPVALYLIAALLLFVGLRDRSRSGRAGVTLERGLSPLAEPDRIAFVAALALSVLIYALVRMDGYGPAGLAAAAIHAALLLAIGRRDAALDGLAAVAASLVLALLATWHMPEIVTRPAPLLSIMGETQGTVPGPLLPPELASFVLVASGLGALVAGGAFVALWGAARPALWAWVSAMTPPAMLGIGYWRVLEFGLDWRWSLAALALAALGVAATARTERYRDDAGLAGATAAYAAGTVAALSLAAALLLQEAWLTVALALQAPALAAVHGVLRHPSLRRLAAIVAGFVAVRLVLNPEIFSYPQGGLPILNWLLYGYGVPAAAFFVAARLFRRERDDWVVGLLEAVALALATILVTLELHDLVAGRIDAWDYRLFEQGLQTAAWAAIAYGLMRARTGRPVLEWGWRILAGLAGLQTVAGHLLLANPLATRASVGPWPLLDLLLLAYAVPAAFAFLFAHEFTAAGRTEIAGRLRAAGGFLLFVYLNMEIRHLYVGARLAPGRIGDAELYTYSAAWLAVAGVLLALGIRTGRTMLRYASLALLLLAVAKVFLIDMSELTGLWRAGSFLGLGLAMVGVGYLYQRYVFPARGPDGRR